jgi:sigma-54 dependent transcriptional regulator, acetoin dehydrogenase operon transcriptional activator AcoR
MPSKASTPSSTRGHNELEEHVLNGGTALTGGSSVSPLLSASWKRSIDHGLRRKDSVLFTNAVSRALERRTVEENHRLLAHATPEMVKLYGGLGSTRWLALFLNVRGQVICSVGDPLSAPNELRALMHPGRSLLESEIGTTAPGCVLELGRPIVVSRGEHYLHELSSFFCASAPVVGPDGTLVGALDLSGIDVQAAPIAANMVTLAARHIENSMLHDLDECVLLHFHFDDRLLGTPSEALLAVSLEGRVVGANRTARQLMSLEGLSATPVQLESLFETSIDRLQISCYQASEPVKIRSHVGALAHVRIDTTPAPQSPRSRSSLARKGPPATTRVFVLRDESLAQGLEKATRALTHGLPVLLQGETGTGKELFARTLHERIRPMGAFLALNCAAIPEGLIEAELFGYADGAFTGGRRGGAKGKIELAHGGVLFLDEIGDMPLTMQSRLLRVLQERTVMRIGGDRELPVDVLFISATHHRLDLLSARQAFREDLFYRLNGFTLQLTPLRERTDVADIIEALVRHAHGARGDGSENLSLEQLITPPAFARLLAHPWPGNIRQLEQTIRQLCALQCADRPIDVIDLAQEFQPPQSLVSVDDTPEPRCSTTYKEAQDHIIQQALSKHGDNIAATARALGISRTTIYKKIKHASDRGRR